MPNLFKTLLGVASTVAIAFNPAAAAELAVAQQISGAFNPAAAAELAVAQQISGAGNVCPARCDDGVRAVARAAVDIPYGDWRDLQSNLRHLNHSAVHTLGTICNDTESDRSKLGWAIDRISYCYEMFAAWIAGCPVPKKAVSHTEIVDSRGNTIRWFEDDETSNTNACADVLFSDTNGYAFRMYGDWCQPDMLGEKINSGLDFNS